MSFGSDMGTFLTSPNAFDAELTVGNEAPAAIYFDHCEVESYIPGYQFILRAGYMDNPGSKNELFLGANPDGTEQGFTLTPDMTYIIGPGVGHIHASFGLEGYVENLPNVYWGDLNCESIVTDDMGKTTFNMRFSIGWVDDQGNDVELRCTALEVTT